MAPRKKTSPAAPPALLSALANPPEGSTAAEQMRVPDKDENTADNDLIAEEIKIDDFCKQQAKTFGEFLKPHKDRQAEIQNIILGRLNQRKVNSISGDAGTAYKSDILNVGIDPEGTDTYVSPATAADCAARGIEPTPSAGREAFLDFALDNWETFGQDGLIFSPQKDAVKKHVEEHGKPPPGVKISYFTRVNIRRS